MKALLFCMAATIAAAAPSALGEGEATFGEKTITCSCGAVLSTASKSPGQKVGCPRCKKIYVIPGK